MSAHKYITVFIPTYNSGGTITECIDAVLRQKLPKGYALDLLVIDSTSTDGTYEATQPYATKGQLRLEQIPNKEFGHGKTRQSAAQKAKGDFILFLSQDATPASNRWLINMIEPFFLSDKIGCVFGRQIPRWDATPTIKREVASVFGALGVPGSIVIQRSTSLVDSVVMGDQNDFFSDVNSAVRRNLLLGRIPFRDVKYAEDQALARDMQKKGYLKAYAPDGAVWHSNEYTAKDYYHRKFDEFIGLQESTGLKLKPSKKSLLLGWIRPTIADLKFVRRDGEYNKRAKVKFALVSPLYNMGAQIGKYNAAKFAKNTKQRAKHSLEKRRAS